MAGMVHKGRKPKRPPDCAAVTHQEIFNAQQRIAALERKVADRSRRLSATGS